MLPKPRRRREKRIVELTRVTYTIAEFCEMTGLNRAAVLRDIDKGSLRVVKVGARRLILAPQVTRPGMRVSGPLTNTGTAPSCRSANAVINDRG
jgi:excisionase family DNA binding protein